MLVTLKDVREVTNRLFDHLEQQGTEAIELEPDYYWFIEKEEAYEPSATPSNPSLGQLSDDWRELEMIRKSERPPIAYALVWLSAVLRAVGEKIVK